MKKYFHILFITVFFIFTSSPFEANAQNATNIALGKTVTAQATTSGTTYNITDGDVSTKWQSDSIWSQWLYINLDSGYNINQIIVRFDSGSSKSYALSYNLLVSNDGTSWTIFDSVRHNQQPINTLSNLSIVGKYVKFQFLGRSGTYYSVKEIEIYGSANASLNNISVYPLASCFTASETRSVTIVKDNIEYTIPVRKMVAHDSVFYDYAQFSFTGNITIKIKNKTAGITSYSIAPNSFDITGTVADSVLSFTLPQSRYVQVILNNQTKRPLFIVADTLQSSVPSSSGLGIYNITSFPYNADNSGKTNVTSIVQQAVNDANANGGGTVFVPSGVFKISKVQTKSNVNIYLQGGAVLMGLTYAQGSASTRMIEGSNVSNIKLYGRGTIWCNGAAANNNHETDVTGGPILIGGVRFTGISSNNLTIDGITFSESTIWTVGFYNGANNIAIKNTKIINATDWNWNDGYDICGAHDADINHCFYVGSDDASCTKVYTGHPVYNVHFNDMVMKSDKSSGFKAGNQAYDSLYDITVENYRIISCMRGFNFDHWYGTGVWGGNITIKNFWIDQVNGKKSSLSACGYIDCPFRFVICNSEDSGVGNVRDVWVENINYPTGPNSPYIRGYNNNYTISNITFKNCRYNGNLVTDSTSGDVQHVAYMSNIKYLYDTNLPLTLKDYTVSIVNHTVAIRWRTASELNNNYFTIEKSYDGQVFSFLTKKNATGEDNSAYSFSDDNLFNGTTYYRLSQTDKDGKTTYLGIKVVNNYNAQNDVLIYPNPTQNRKFTVKLNEPVEENKAIQLIDYKGRIVWKERNIQKNNTIQVALDGNIASGIYLLKVNDLKPVKLILR